MAHVSRDDWYRSRSWSAEVEAAFYARLRRSRTDFNKAQYLRIQASYLTSVRPEIALRLFDECLALGSRFEQAPALAGKAEAYLAAGDIEQAARMYEASIALEREYPSVRTNAYIDFAVLVAVQRMKERYLLILEILDERARELTFPVDRYRYFGARALVLREQGLLNDAKANAEVALAAVSESHSGFIYHRDVGLVERTDDDFGRRVRALAENMTDTWPGKLWTLVTSKLLH